MSHDKVTATEIDGERAVIEFTPTQAADVLRLLDDLEDILELVILYHVEKEDGRSTSIQRCCAYSAPTFEYIFKVNAVCDGDKRCGTLYVTLYDSLETLGFQLLDELRRQTAENNDVEDSLLPFVADLRSSSGRCASCCRSGCCGRQ